jgi:hypothetical protein
MNFSIECEREEDGRWIADISNTVGTRFSRFLNLARWG